MRVGVRVGIRVLVDEGIMRGLLVRVDVMVTNRRGVFVGDGTGEAVADGSLVSVG